MAYVSPMAVLKLAGLWNQEIGETPVGTTNGSNAVFTTIRKPLVPRTDSDTVTTADVAAYVEGIPVVVASVDATTGAVTLSSAPAADTDVTLDYAASAVSLSDVASATQEAEGAINDAMTGAVTPIPYTSVPATIRKIARFYAAGLLMASEYGLESITEETTKEGERKIAKAEAWLASYRATIVTNTAETGDYDVPRSTPDKRIFEQYDSSNGRWDPLSDSPVTIRRPE